MQNEANEYLRYFEAQPPYPPNKFWGRSAARVVLSVFLLVLVVSGAVMADRLDQSRDSKGVISDTLIGLEKDTLTLIKPTGADVLQVTITPDSGVGTAATDSLAAWNRALTTGTPLADYHTIVGSMMAIKLLADNGDETYVLNWRPGGPYTILLDPFGGTVQQFILQGSAGDTIYYDFRWEWLDNQ